MIIKQLRYRHDGQNFKKSTVEMKLYQEEIRLLMKQKKVTQKDLTKLTGVRQATISDWLNGKQDINVKTLEKLLKALE